LLGRQRLDRLTNGLPDGDPVGGWLDGLCCVEEVRAAAPARAATDLVDESPLSDRVQPREQRVGRSRKTREGSRSFSKHSLSQLFGVIRIPDLSQEVAEDLTAMPPVCRFGKVDPFIFIVHLPGK